MVGGAVVVGGVVAACVDGGVGGFVAGGFVTGGGVVCGGVTGGVVCGGLVAPATVMVPFMVVGWTEQWYAYVPAVVNVREYVASTSLTPESWAASNVTEWFDSRQHHVTVVPGCTVFAAGS